MSMFLNNSSWDTVFNRSQTCRVHTCKAIKFMYKYLFYPQRSIEYYALIIWMTFIWIFRKLLLSGAVESTFGRFSRLKKQIYSKLFFVLCSQTFENVKENI